MTTWGSTREVPATAAWSALPGAACSPGTTAGTPSCPSSLTNSTPPPVNASQENWVELNQSSLPDANLNGLGLAYDAKSDETVLFGACPTDLGSPCNETWAFRQGNWTALNPLVSPPDLEDVAMAYDPQSESDHTLRGRGPIGPEQRVRGNSQGGNWSELNTTIAPPAGAGLMVYDSAAGYLLLFAGGGPNATNGTWTFENGTWTDLSVSVEPPYAASMAYDPNLRAAVAYIGGYPTRQLHVVVPKRELGERNSGRLAGRPERRHPHL